MSTKVLSVMESAFPCKYAPLKRKDSESSRASVEMAIPFKLSSLIVNLLMISLRKLRPSVVFSPTQAIKLIS